MARGSIRKYVGKDGSYWWQVVVEMKDPVTGKRKQKRITVHGTKADAERFLNEKMHELNHGLYSDPGKMTLADYLKYWIDNYCKQNLADRTLERYVGIINQHIIPSLGNIPLSKLVPAQIQKFYTDALEHGRKDNKKSKGQSLSPATVTYFHRVLHEALKHAVNLGFLSYNPADRVKPPSRKADGKEGIKVLTDEQIAGLLDAVKGTYLYMPVYLAIMTGARLGEILALKWSDVDLDRKVIQITGSLQQRKKDLFKFKTPKSGRGRAVEIFDYTVKELKRYKIAQSKQRLAFGEGYHDYDLVCCQPNGLPLNPATVSSRFLDVSKRLGLGVSFHDLRHTHASIMLRLGIPPKIVSERLGHSTTRITEDIYMHTLPTLQKDAARLFEETLFKNSVTNS